MALNTLLSAKGRHRRKKLLGRGPGSGHGKTSTRGHKGQRARAGRDFYLGFEGGQSPLARRVPKRGFTHIKKECQLVNLKSLSGFTSDTVIDPQFLEKQGLIKRSRQAVKILGDGELKAALTVKAAMFSQSAIKKIQKAGGKFEIIK